MAEDPREEACARGGPADVLGADHHRDFGESVGLALVTALRTPTTPRLVVPDLAPAERRRTRAPGP